MWHENSNAVSERDINLHRVYTGRERRDATKYNRTYYNWQISDSKLLTSSIYDILTQSSKDLQKHGKCEVKKCESESDMWPSMVAHTRN